MNIEIPGTITPGGWFSFDKFTCEVPKLSNRSITILAKGLIGSIVGSVLCRVHLASKVTVTLQDGTETTLYLRRRELEEINRSSSVDIGANGSTKPGAIFATVFSQPQAAATAQDAPAPVEAPVATENYLPPVPDLYATATATSTVDLPSAATLTEAMSRNVPLSLEAAKSAYEENYFPQANLSCLQTYLSSEEYKAHLKTARIYYNSEQLSQKDALRVIYQREPTNMQEVHHQSKACKEVLGHTTSVYYDKTAKKENEVAFYADPNSACVYSETCCWQTPGDESTKVRIGCLSVPAPALDVPDQPHFGYYVSEEGLDTEKYQAEMEFLFKTIERAIRDNHSTAFNGQGFKRIFIPRFGQFRFLEALNWQDQGKAQAIFNTQLQNCAKRIADLNIPVVSSIPFPDSGITKERGNVPKAVQDGDFIVNAWDPHSAPGNGNEWDRSFDGGMGKGSGILFTQTPWFNVNLRKPESLVACSIKEQPPF